MRVALKPSVMASVSSTGDPDAVTGEADEKKCGPCRMIAAVIEELAVDSEGRAKVAKVDVDDNPRVAARYGIRSIPTLLLFKDGQVVDRVIGVAPKKVLADKLTVLLKAA